MLKKVKYFSNYFKAHQSLHWRVVAREYVSGVITVHVGKDQLIEIESKLFRIPPLFEESNAVPIATCSSFDQAKELCDELEKLPNTVRELFNSNTIKVKSLSEVNLSDLDSSDDSYTLYVDPNCSNEFFREV